MKNEKLTTKENLLPFILITALFFLWGIAHGMLDTLNKHFQDMLELSKAKSGMIQFSVYMAYFGMALPAGFFMRKYGYKKGIILGLSLFASGALLIAGTTSLESFWVFLICLFIMGCGLATLETAANPYTTKLGPKETAERRINFSQSFNGLAWVIGPLIGLYIYKGNNAGEGDKLSSMVLPYLAIAAVVIAVAVLFVKTPLPEITEEEDDLTQANGDAIDVSFLKKPLLKQKHFVMGVIAQFSYVAAQTGIFSYLINFVTDENQNPHFDFSGNWFCAFYDWTDVGQLFYEFFQTNEIACYICSDVLFVIAICKCRTWMGFINQFVRSLFLYVNHVPYHICIRDQRFGAKNKESFIIYCDGHSWRSSFPSCNGMDC